MEELNRSLAGQSSSSWNSNPDDSLTSLHWLQEFSSRGQVTPSHQPRASTAPSAGGRTKRVDFSTSNIRPPYTYANLIHLAMQASNQPKITLACIYRWIRENFSYYRHADPTWQNTIRHTLSINECFVKVPRQKNEPGKGGFWAFDPRHGRRLHIMKNRKLPPVRINPPSQDNVQVEVKSVPTLAATAVEHQESCITSSLDVKEDLSALDGTFDWDALVDSAVDTYFGMNEGRPLGPDESQEAQVMLESQRSSESDCWNVSGGTDLNFLDYTEDLIQIKSVFEVQSGFCETLFTM